MEPRVVLIIVVLVLSLLPTTSPSAGADAAPVQAGGVTSASPAPKRSTGPHAPSATSRAGRTHVLTVANANVREGSRVRLRKDLRVGHDRKTFVRRLMKRVARMPGVVVLQETAGSAKAYVRAFNRHPRVERAGASYRLVTSPRLRSGQRHCGPVRRARHQHVKTTSILVNRASVRSVTRRGSVGTWGRWRQRPGRTRTVAGCAHQPWALLRTRSGGMVRVVGVHFAPVNPRLKTRAARRLTERLSNLQRAERDAALVVTGDFNLSRQPLSRGEREPAGGKVRAAHRMMRAAGLRDANRVARPRGRNGVVGYRGRIDFLYTSTRVANAAFDRCYLGYRGGRPCPRARSTFPAPATFAACQRRADSGNTRKRGCSQRSYRRYSSDHPMITARLRW